MEELLSYRTIFSKIEFPPEINYLGGFLNTKLRFMLRGLMRTEYFSSISRNGALLQSQQCTVKTSENSFLFVSLEFLMLIVYIYRQQ